MHCTHIKILLPKYIDDELTPGEENLIDVHLQTCQDCRHLMRDMNKERALSRLMDETIATDVDEEESRKLSLYEKINLIPRSIKLSLGVALLFMVTAVTAKYIFYTKITVKKTDTTLTETFIPKDSLPYNKAKHSIHTRQITRRKTSPSKRENVRSNYTVKGPLSIEPDFARFPQTYNLTFEVTNIENIIHQLSGIVSEFDGSVIISQSEDDNTYTYAFQLSNSKYPELLARLKRIGHIKEKDKISTPTKANNVSYSIIQLKIIQY